VIPVDQTVFGQAKGNCYSACVASILELSLERVPWFMGPGSWSERFEKWLEPFGFYPLWLEKFTPAGWAIAGGVCSRGNHAVVTYGGETIHDPHPSRDGLTRIEDWTLFIPFDPIHGLIRLLDAKNPG